MGDLYGNMYQDLGYFKCHGTGALFELLLTPDGDLAIVDDDATQRLQEIMMYWGTKPGERVDPKLGNIMHSMQFEKMIGDNISNLELGLERNFKENFPDFTDAQIQAQMYNANTLYIKMKVGKQNVQVMLNEASLRSWGYQVTGRIGIRNGPTID